MVAFSKKWKQRMYEERKKFLASAKIASGCVDCGLWGPDELLSFDHVRGEKIISIGSQWDVSLERVKEEISKCDVVCLNCHAIRTNKRIQEKATGLPPFEGFPKIARLSRLCLVTEKIDGTNSTVWVDGDGDVWAASKNRWVTPEDDNYGFAKWVSEHEDAFRETGDGVYRGEWWGQGIQRNYGLKEKRFSLFNVMRWINNEEERNDDKQLVRPACCHIVPILMTGMFDEISFAGVMKNLSTTGSLAAPGFMKPEGIVIFHLQGNVGFKKTFEKDQHGKWSDE